jgi:hypothetical protein
MSALLFPPPLAGEVPAQRVEGAPRRFRVPPSVSLRFALLDTSPASGGGKTAAP